MLLAATVAIIGFARHPPPLLQLSSGLQSWDEERRQLLISAQTPLGLLLEEVDGGGSGCFVAELVDGGAAATAGVLPGDRLIAVNNADVSNTAFEDVMARLELSPRVVNLRFERPDAAASRGGRPTMACAPPLRRRAAISSTLLALAAPWRPASAATAPATLGPTAQGSLRQCTLPPTEQGCVSSSPASAPNRFLAPLRYDEISREQAYRRVRAYLSSSASPWALDAANDSPEYLHAGSDEEDLELRFLPDDNAVTFRLLAKRPTPMPAFCASRGCINGNADQRKRLEMLRDEVGFRSDEARFDGEKYDGWVPIFLH